MTAYRRTWLVAFVIYALGLAFYFVSTPDSVSSGQWFLAVILLPIPALVVSYVVVGICELWKGISARRRAAPEGPWTTAARKRNCHCDVWDTDPALYRKAGYPLGFCGVCERCGRFRFNLIDLLLIAALIGASAAWYALMPDRYLFLLPLYVGGSFFLFCNVFRIGNRLERPWYVTFVAIAVYGFTLPEFPWMLLLIACEALKRALIGYRIRRGPYVGAFHRQLSRLSAA